MVLIILIWYSGMTASRDLSSSAIPTLRGKVWLWFDNRSNWILEKIAPLICAYSISWSELQNKDLLWEIKLILIEEGSVGNSCSVFRWSLPQMWNICPNCKMYLSKLQNVFVQIAKCICQNCKMYLSKLQNVLVQLAKCMCPELLSACPSWSLRACFLLRKNMLWGKIFVEWFARSIKLLHLQFYLRPEYFDLIAKHVIQYLWTGTRRIPRSWDADISTWNKFDCLSVFTHLA